MLKWTILTITSIAFIIYITWVLSIYVNDESTAIDKEWDDWQKNFKSKGIRFGQYFLNKHPEYCPDPVLFYMSDDRKAREYIEDELEDDIDLL